MNIIMALRQAAFHICLFMSVFIQERFCEAILENGTTAFDCSFTVFDKERIGYINCSFNLIYRKEELTIECFRNTHSGMGITFSKGQTFVKRENMFSNALKCFSNSPMSVDVGFNDGVGLPSFTETRQKRIIEEYSNTSSYKYELTMLLSKVEARLQENILVKYKIFSYLHPVLETNVVLEFAMKSPDKDMCGRSYKLFSYFVEEFSTQEFIEIPVVQLSEEPLTLRRQICRGKFAKTCEETKSNLIEWCYEFPDLNVVRTNISYSNYSYQKYIPLATLFDALGIQDERLIILKNENPTLEQIRSITGLITNSTDRPIVVNNQNIDSRLYNTFFDKLKAIPQSWWCVPQTNLTYDQLQYLLQELFISERLIGGEDLLSYNPLTGFNVSSQLLMRYGPGIYSAWSTDCKLFDHLTIYFSDIGTFPSSPNIRDIRFPMYAMLRNQVDNSLTLTCSSNSKNVSIKLMRTKVRDEAVLFETLNVTFETQEVPDAHHRFRATAVVDLHKHEDEYFTMAHFKCLPFEVRRYWTLYTKRYHTQRFSYVAEKHLFVCNSNIQTIHRQWYCKNRVQCEIIQSNCLNNYYKLPPSNETFSVSQKYNCMQSLIDTRIKPCSEEGDFGEKSDQCSTLQPAEKGIVQCMDPKKTFLGTFDLHYTYFKGFDDRIYIENEMTDQPPINATLRINNLNTQQEFYVNGEYMFHCEAQSFFYDHGIQWFLKFLNGTTMISKNENSFTENMALETVAENSESRLRITIPDVSLEEIICSAPNSGNGEWQNISFKLDVLESFAPKINASESEVRLREDVQDQGITCKASGTPLPKITWTKGNKQIEEPLRVADENILLFPIYNSTFAGEYWCNASNVAGYDLRKFYVQGKEDKQTVLSNTIIGVTATIIFSSLLFSITYYRHEKRKKYRELKEIIRVLNGSPKNVTEVNENEEDSNPINFPFNENYDIAKNSFILDKKKLLGKGEFGVVYKGILDGIDRTVAFKTVLPNCDIVNLKALVSEVKILMYIGPHSNLITLLGVYRQEIKSGILYVAIEYCELGSLESYLRNNKTNFNKYVFGPSSEKGKLRNNQPRSDPSRVCSVKALMKWSKQIATGMEFLAMKKVVHADLATRNVLLTSEGNAKVTDFGLSKRTYNYSEYVKSGKDPLPWRWSAIECFLTNTFSSKSDVWSYGITLWELFSLGDVPYPGMDYTLDFPEKLEKGLINTKPKWASDEIYTLMVLCWNLDADKRPTFLALKTILEGIEDSIHNNTKIDVKDFVDKVIQIDSVELGLANMDYVVLN